MSNDLHTYIEPELEARITALVLGEVGEFDVDELERIIQEQPELQIFRRRMEAMHGLLGETVKSEKGEAWQLSDDRRATLRRTFSQKPEPLQRKSHVITRTQWRSAMGIAVCLTISLILYFSVEVHPPQDHFTPEIVSYQEASSEALEKGNAEPEKEIVWIRKTKSASAPPRSDSSKSDRSYRTKKGEKVPTLDELPQIGRLFKSKKKAEKGKDTSVAQHRSTQKREMTRAVTHKPSAPSSSMAKVIAANTSSNTAIPVPEMDVPDPSVAFGDADDFGGVWENSESSGAFGSTKMAKNEGLDADNLTVEAMKLSQNINFITSGENSRFGGDKYRASGRAATVSSGVRIVREFIYPTEYGPSERPNLGMEEGVNAEAFAVTPATPTSFETRDTGVTMEIETFSDTFSRSNPAQTAEHKKNVDEVRKNLYMGYYNLGQYDEAEEEMKKVLQKDPYNKDARRGLEKVAAIKSDYYSAAYDQTRANLLAEVDSAWEMEMTEPADKVLRNELKIGAEKIKEVQKAMKEGEEVVSSRSDRKESGKLAKPRKKAQALKPSPKRPQPLPEETTTSTQPFSTFSLNVSDVSFKLAKVALLEKGQWPESSKVRTEEFVNAFDYGDPSPRRGESVACAIEQTAHPFLQQRNLLRIGMKTAALGRSTPLRLTVLLDNSGSMEREDREASVLAAIRVLAAQLGPQDKITLVGFARTPRLLADRISGDKAGQLVNIVANTPSEGGTNIEEALQLARKLAKRQHTDGAQDRIVLITDGVANLGNTVPDELSRQIEIMRQEGIAFDACGVGAEGLNDEILEAMTRKGDGRYYFLNRPEDADSGFAKQLAGALSPAAKNVKVQVVFNPKRVSKYRLLGFNKHRLNKEDFRNDQVDAAEMAAEEAGNAVYQIEVNPNGEGELGEVFVRFLDANTNRMVERSWPMAYESQVKPFDLTTASMQLAGVSSQLGEKLHGTDAGSVRFQNISNTLGKLRAHYQHNPKVQDLIRMCEKVK